MTYDSTTAFQEAELPWWLLLIEGIAAIIIGIMLLAAPVRMSIFLVQLLAIYWLIKGIVSIISVFVDHTAWGWKLFIGIVGIIAGWILIQYPIGSTAVVGATFIIVLGIQGILMGVVELVQAFRGGGWGIGILGALSIIIGIWLLANVWVSAAVIPWVLGILAIAGGIVAIIQAFRSR